MTRPPSIIWFERCYLGVLLIGLINVVLQWDEMNARMAALPNGAALATYIIPFTLTFSFGISLLLWYFVARRAAVVAKWIVVIFFALSVISVPFALIRGQTTGLPGVIAVVAFVLHAIAVWTLFRRDANAWFAKRPSDLGNTFS